MKIQKNQDVGNGEFSFYCPGCDSPHTFGVDHGAVRWSFNGDMDVPTLSPSYKTWGETKFIEEDPGWKREKWVCHSFIKNGNIDFCSDTTHELRNKTVPLPDFP